MLPSSSKITSSTVIPSLFNTFKKASQSVKRQAQSVYHRTKEAVRRDTGNIQSLTNSRILLDKDDIKSELMSYIQNTNNIISKIKENNNLMNENITLNEKKKF